MRIAVLTKRRIDTIIPLQVGNEVTTSPAVRYLGVVIDTKMTFWRQILRTANKADCRPESTDGRCRRSQTEEVQIADDGGPIGAILYGSKVWPDVLDKELYRKRLAQVQRREALRVVSTYPTVSEPGVLVVVGVISVTLLAQERRRVIFKKDV